MLRFPCLVAVARSKAGSQGSSLSRKAVWLASLVILMVLALPAAAWAATCGPEWKGPAEGGAWGTAANWSSGTVPGAGEVACIGAGVKVLVSAGAYQVGVVQGEGALVLHEGTLEVTDAAEPSAISSLSLEYGAVLTGAGTVEVSGSFSWDGGSKMSGSGLTVVSSGATGSVTASAELDGRTLVNEGTFTFSEGSIFMDEGAEIDNSGQFNANEQGGFGISTEGRGAAPLIVNTGTFDKTAGEEGARIEVDFENSGTITTTSGHLVFGEKEVAVTLASGSVLEGTEVFNKATITGGSFKAPSGKVTVEYGSLTISEGSSASINNFTMNAEGNLAGAGTLDLPGTFSWSSSGKMSGTGSTVIKPGATGAIEMGGDTAYLAERTLINEGTFTLGKGILSLSKNAVVKNMGTFNANTQALFGITAESKDLSGLFINKGILQKTEGTEKTKIEVNFENEGTVEAKTGEFVIGENNNIAVTLASGSNLAGEILVNDGTVLGGSFKASHMVIEHATLSIAKGSTASIANFTMNYESVITGAGTLDLTGTFLWNIPSTMSGSGTTVVTPGATASTASSSMKLTERTLVNEGTFTWDSGWLEMSNGARLENTGTFNANDQETRIIVPEGERERPAPLLVNAGKFQKTEGTGETKVEVPFENNGVLVQKIGKVYIKTPVSREPSTQYGGHNPSAPGQEGSKCGDPVDCATGDFSETETDISIGGKGVGLALTRTYNSQAAVAGVSGAFGPGWGSSFSDHVVVGQGKAVLYQGNGSTVSFAEGKGGSFTPPIWSQDSMNGSEKAGYSVVLGSQIKYQFEGSTGRLQSVTDRNGNQTKLAYNKAGQLETITDPAGRTITLAYNKEGFIESAKDPMGHTIKYTYEEGDLASVTEPGESKARWHYKYDGSHQMTTLTDGREGKTSNEYDSSHRVISQTDPAEHTLTFEYEPFQTKTTNHSTGSVTLEQFTSSNQPYLITRGFGTESATTETFTYDAENDLTSVTDGNGHITSYTYENGNKTSMVDPDKNETKWTYNGTHDVLTVTPPDGEKTTITRDSHGNAETVSCPAPHGTTQTTTYHYDGNGDLTSIVNPVKQTWSYEYDSKGNRTNETDPEGDKRTYGYNEDSQETSNISPKGNIKGGEPSQYTTKIERDEQGRPKTITNPLGQTNKYAYDADGNIETQADPNGRTTTYTYNPDNELTKVKAPNGDTTETGYDGAGRVTSQTDGNKHTTTYTRNILEEVTEIKDPLGRATKKEDDAAGNLTALIDAAKRTTKYSYDPANRLKEISYSESKTPAVKYEYNGDGERTKTTDGTGTTTYTYDLLDRLVKSTDGHGDSTGYEYDLANNQTKLTYPNKNLITRAYDNAGRLQSVTDWSGNTTTFSYDPNSNLTTTNFPKGTSEQDKASYNAANQVMKITMTGSGLKVLASLAYTRDNDGQIKSTTTAGLPGTESISDTYDTNNRLEKAGSTAYAYDAADEPTTLGSSTSVYDAAGELKTNGSDIYGYDQLGERVSTTPKGGQTTTFGYDQAGNLIQVKQGKTSGLNDNYAYNGDGLRASQVKGKATSYMTWDTHAELPLILSDEQSSYIYGPGSIPIEQIQSKGAVLYLHDDQQGSTRMLTSATGTIEATDTYDAYGNTTGATGNTTSPIGYDGQYTNTDTGLIYLRARSYDPATAQFLSTDPLDGITHARYNYAGDSPFNEADPTGLWLGLGIPSPGEVVEALNPVKYYEKEISSYENGCGYFASVGHGLEGAIVGTLDASGIGALGASAAAGIGGEEASAAIEEVLAGLEPGSSPGVYVVDSPEELQQIYDELSAGGKPTGSSYPGQEVELPDGTRVGIRETSKTGGLTIDINQGGTQYKIHVAE